MKRLLALTLTLLLLLGMLGLFAGCQDTDAPATTPASSEPTPPPTDTAPAATVPPVTTEPPETEFTLPREPGTNQLTFYWTAPGVDYSTCDMWIWYPNADGRGYLFHPCDYGAKVVLNVPEGIEEVGFIVRKNCSEPGGTSWGEATKDYDDDRFAVLTGEETVIYLKTGDGAQYMSNDGGKTLTQTKLFSLAAIIDMDQIQYFISPAATLTPAQVKVLDGSRELHVSNLSSANNNVVTGVITVDEELDFSKTYTVQIEGFEPQTAVPTKVFDAPAFEEKYAYDGDDLGAVIDGANTTFKLWAPTASKVVLNLFDAGDGGVATQKLDMTLGEKGVWSLTVPCGHGTYYTYSVTTAVGTQEAVDPYAKAVGVNGNRGMVIDLSKTDPAGFDKDEYYQDLDAYNEALIWEVHVRDFSKRIADSQYPGLYLAFTETGMKNASGESIGMDYLKDLGVTHIHFQPLYDYATVDETRVDAPFNWGYDPKNYNAPEGSYSTDPFHGEVRVNELKQMIQALHQAGMAVVMDVVYNHTYDINSNLNRVVPYYYYRYNAAGAPSNGSGCGNETASERVMFRKYMVDSVSYWAKEYHIDGFRFDLMGLHDVTTMQAIETAVHEINPKAILYGEGWTGGTTPLNANQQATLSNIHKIEATGDGIGAVAGFNDVIRDGLKGSVFDAKDQGYINGKANKATAEKVIFGLMGGQKSAAATWSVENNMVINYMACHDNNTLWDKLLKSNASATEEERFQMYRLGEAIVMIGKGVPFCLAGEEMLRTKNGDSNSYASSDAINNIDWDALTPDSNVMRMRDFYRGLIEMRKANDFFTQGEMTCVLLDNNVIQVTWTMNGAEAACAYINPNAAPISVELPAGAWGVLLREETFGGTETLDGSAEVAGRSVLVLTR